MNIHHKAFMSLVANYERKNLIGPSKIIVQSKLIQDYADKRDSNP